MHHVAIMNPIWQLIPKILAGEKTIESRWYQTRRAPWQKVAAGDTIFFKNSWGGLVASALVEKVQFYEVASLDEAQALVDRYGDAICLPVRDVSQRKNKPRYVILMWLRDAQSIPSVMIDKTWYGVSTARLVCEDIQDLGL